MLCCVVLTVLFCDDFREDSNMGRQKCFSFVLYCFVMILIMVQKRNLKVNQFLMFPVVL